MKVVKEKYVDGQWVEVKHKDPTAEYEKKAWAADVLYWEPAPAGEATKSIFSEDAFLAAWNRFVNPPEPEPTCFLTIEI